MSPRTGSPWLAALLTVVVIGTSVPLWAQEEAPSLSPASQPVVQDESLPPPMATTQPAPVAATAPAPSTQPIEIVVVSTEKVDMTGEIRKIKATLKPRYSEWEMIVEYSVKTRFNAGALGIPLELRVNAMVDGAIVRDRRWNPVESTIRLETPTSVIEPFLGFIGHKWYCYRGKVTTLYPFFPFYRRSGISMMGTLVVGNDAAVTLDQEQGNLEIEDLRGKK